MKKKTSLYPSKTSLNLCIKEDGQFAPKKVIPLLAVVLVLAALLGKFGVADLLSAKAAAESRLNTLNAQKLELAAATVDYDQVLEEYSRYSTGWMTDGERLSLKRTDMLTLVEQEFMPVCQVQNVTVAGNVLSVNLNGVALDGVSALVQTLYARADVENVTVYTASNDAEGGHAPTVSMVITMADASQGGEQG